MQSLEGILFFKRCTRDTPELCKHVCQWIAIENFKSAVNVEVLDEPHAINSPPSARSVHPYGLIEHLFSETLRCLTRGAAQMDMAVHILDLYGNDVLLTTKPNNLALKIARTGQGRNFDLRNRALNRDLHHLRVGLIQQRCCLGSMDAQPLGDSRFRSDGVLWRVSRPQEERPGLYIYFSFDGDLGGEVPYLLSEYCGIVDKRRCLAVRQNLPNIARHPQA